MPPKISSIIAAKKILKRKLVRRAARKYTHVWDKIMREAMGIAPKTNKVPPNFVGNQNEKFRRALLYKNRIVNYALKHPKTHPILYRGIEGWELNQFRKSSTVNKNTLTSFSKRKNVAKNFAANPKFKHARIILVLKSNKPIPSVNFTNGTFQSEYAPGGKFYKRDEQEVLLPPGKFTVRKVVINKTNNTIGKVYVKFNARNYVPPKPTKQPSPPKKFTSTPVFSFGPPPNPTKQPSPPFTVPKNFNFTKHSSWITSGGKTEFF